LVGEVIGIAYVIFEGGFNSRERFFVQAEDKFFCGGSGEDLVKEYFEIGIGNRFKAERWLAHFTDALANGGGVFGAEVGVEAEGHFEFVKGFAGDARRENLVQAFESVMVAFVTADAFFYGEARLHGILDGAEAGEGRRAANGSRGIHDSNDSMKLARAAL